MTYMPCWYLSPRIIPRTRTMTWLVVSCMWSYCHLRGRLFWPRTEVVRKGVEEKSSVTIDSSRGFLVPSAVAAHRNDPIARFISSLNSYHRQIDTIARFSFLGSHTTWVVAWWTVMNWGLVSAWITAVYDDCFMQDSASLLRSQKMPGNHPVFCHVGG